MVRQIHTNTDTEHTAQQQEPVTEAVSTTAAVAQPTVLPVSQDALAGALPDWDLLPATAFVRRKRS